MRNRQTGDQDLFFLPFTADTYQRHHMPPAEAPAVVSLDEQQADIQYGHRSSHAEDNTPKTMHVYREQFSWVLDLLPEHKRQVAAGHHEFQDGTYRTYPILPRRCGIEIYGLWAVLPNSEQAQEAGGAEPVSLFFSDCEQ